MPTNDSSGPFTADAWKRLTSAHDAYHAAVSPFYDEVLHEVAQAVDTFGSIGKRDIGALVLWKRMNTSARWATELLGVPEASVRKTTSKAVTAVRDPALDRSTAAREGRRALLELPGFVHGDALASALLTAAAPRRMAIYDSRAHAALHDLHVPLGNKAGRYARYMHILDRALSTAPAPATAWTARDLDIALYWFKNA